jgi:hypothetical protein
MTGDPTTYKEALSMLQGYRRSHQKKLCNNTYLKGRLVPDGSMKRDWYWSKDGGEPTYFAVVLHGVEVVKMYKDGRYQLAGINSWTTRDRINRFSPFRACTWGGYGIIETDTGSHPYFPHMMMQPNGELVLPTDDEWFNTIDASDYIDKSEKYAGFLARKLVYGRLEGHDPATLPVSDEELVKAVLAKEYSFNVALQLIDDAGEIVRYRKLLDTLKPEVYRRYWLKPHTVDEELERYSNDLVGRTPAGVVPGRSFKHPRRLQPELKGIFTNVLRAAAKLEKAERSPYRG